MGGSWAGERVTVTGGAGFLGQHLVRRLERPGASVFVPRRRDHDLTGLDSRLRCLLEHPCGVLLHAAASPVRPVPRADRVPAPVRRRRK